MVSDWTHPASKARSSSATSGRRQAPSKDAGVPVGPAKTGEFSIGQLVESREEVDTVLEQARSAGATVVDGAHERPWGIYSGYFCDPDGHLWEIIYNP